MPEEKIDYVDAEKAPQYVLFKTGLYRCEIIEVEDKPQNEYQGKPSPCYTLKVKPLETAMPDASGSFEMYGTDGKKRLSDYADQEGNEKQRFIYVNVTKPLKITEKTTFGKIFTAIAGGTDVGEKQVKDNYLAMSDYVGQTVVCQIAIREKQDGSNKNAIDSWNTDAKNVLLGSGDSNTAVAEAKEVMNEPVDGDKKKD